MASGWRDARAADWTPGIVRMRSMARSKNCCRPFLVVADQTHLRRQRRDAGRSEAEVDLAAPRDAPRQESGGDEQHERDRGLAGDERVPQRPASAAGSAERRRFPLQLRRQVRSTCARSAGASPASRPAIVATAIVKSRTRVRRSARPVPAEWGSASASTESVGAAMPRARRRPPRRRARARRSR